MQGQEALQKEKLNHPIGANSVCPHCHLMHIWRDCGHWHKETENGAPPEKPKPKKVLIPLAELLGGIPPSKPKKTRKPKPLKEGPATFYAWTNSDGEYVKQRGIKSPNAMYFAKQDADFVSVGQFSKGGNGKNRTLENLESVNKCFSDIDSNTHLEWQEIVSTVARHGIPPINRITPTPTPNHYQPTWDVTVTKDKLGLWLAVQEGIHKMFESLGADPIPVKNPTQYLRSPEKYKPVYENKAKTNIHFLYYALKKVGLIQTRKQESKPRKRHQKSFSKVTLPKLRAYFKENNSFDGTHKEIYTKLGIPERTYFYLLPVLYREGLRTTVKRVGKTWKTHFQFDTARNNLLNRGGGGLGVYGRALDRAKQGGIVENYRNVGVFTLALWLHVVKKWGDEQVLSELQGVFLATVSKSTGFSRSEFERTVKSACSGRYLCFPKWGGKREFLERLCIGLNLECEKKGVGYESQG